MSVTSPSQYKANKTKTIELPSFLEDGVTHPKFKIRKANSRLLMAFYDMIGVEGNDETISESEINTKMEAKLETTAGKKEMLELLDSIIINTVVEPKVVSGVAQADDELSVDDIELIDQRAILEQVIIFTGATAKGEEVRKKSRRTR